MFSARTSSFLFKNSHSAFFVLVAIFFFFYLGDSIISYLAPVMMENALGSASAMGLLFSTSSMAGMVADILFPKLFAGKTSRFFFRLLFALVFLFPISFLLFPNTIGFAIGMIVWGVYFEAFAFARFHAIKETVERQNYGWAWGNMAFIQNIALVLGPLFAGLLMKQSNISTLYLVIFLFLISAYIFIIREFLLRKKKLHVSKKTAGERRSLHAELLIWKAYGHVLWPLFIYLFIFFLIDSAFHTIGPLVAEKMNMDGPFAGLFVSIYSVPGLFVTLLVPKLAKPFGKKRLAFLSGLAGSACLLLLAWVSSTWAILTITFIGAIGINIMYPALLATMEDYLQRSEKTANDLIGLTALFGSSGYVMGPMLSGIFADLWSPQAVFAIWGGVMAVYSIYLLFTVKRKIRLPQQELALVSRVHH